MCRVSCEGENMSSSFYNRERYPDPTAYEALLHLEGRKKRRRKKPYPDAYPVDWKRVTEDEDFAWEELANAVVFQAALDWREARDRLSRNPHDKQALAMRRETEAFFLSEYYMHLTEVDGDYLLERLRREG